MGADYKPRAKQMLLANSAGVVLVPNATRYGVVNGTFTIPAAEGNAGLLASRSGIMSEMYVEVAGALGAGESAVFTFRVNGVGTALTVTIAGAVQTQGQDLLNQVAYAAGDMLTIDIVTSLNCAAVRPHWSMVAKNA